MVEGKNLTQVLNTISILAEENTTESWKVIDSFVEYLEPTMHEIPNSFFVNCLTSEKDAYRDLGATMIAKVDMDKLREKLNSQDLVGLADNVITGLRELIIKGMNDEYEYAQLRSVMAAIEHNWITVEQWEDSAKPVLLKYVTGEMHDVVTLSLKKGRMLYE